MTGVRFPPRTTIVVFATTSTQADGSTWPPRLTAKRVAPLPVFLRNLSTFIRPCHEWRNENVRWGNFTQKRSKRSLFEPQTDIRTVQQTASLLITICRRLITADYAVTLILRDLGLLC